MGLGGGGAKVRKLLQMRRAAGENDCEASGEGGGAEEEIDRKSGKETTPPSISSINQSDQSINQSIVGVEALRVSGMVLVVVVVVMEDGMQRHKRRAAAVAGRGKAHGSNAASRAENSPVRQCR